MSFGWIGTNGVRCWDSRRTLLCDARRIAGLIEQELQELIATLSSVPLVLRDRNLVERAEGVGKVGTGLVHRIQQRLDELEVVVLRSVNEAQLRSAHNRGRVGVTTDQWHCGSSFTVPSCASW